MSANIRDFGHNNSVLIENEKNSDLVYLTIHGDNNRIIIKNSVLRWDGKLNIQLNAENSELYIDEGLYVGSFGLVVCLGNRVYKAASNSCISIGRNLSVGGLQIISYNSNTRVKIGNDVMVAWGVMIYNTDAHPIYDIETEEIINSPHEISIANNCWLGADSKILKNVKLLEGTIVGMGAIVTKSFHQSNVAIAGNPARIVRENVKWKAYDAKYIENEL